MEFGLKSCEYRSWFSPPLSKGVSTVWALYLVNTKREIPAKNGCFTKLARRSVSKMKPHLFDEVKGGDVTRVVLKTRQQYNNFDKREVEKSHKVRKLLMCGIGENEYDLISSCESAKEIWNRLRIVYEGTEQTKKSKLDLLTTQFESFTLEEGESIYEMRTRFSTITNELMFLEEPVTAWKQAGDPEVLSMNALFEHLQVHEMDRRKESFTLKGKNKRRDPIPDKKGRKVGVADNVVKKALAVWGDSSSDSEESKHSEDASMLAVKDDEDCLMPCLLLWQNLMMKKLKKRGKGEASSLQIELENSLNTAETKLALALERNDQLERDLVRLKEELKNSLKWINSSKLLANLTSQEGLSSLENVSRKFLKLIQTEEQTEEGTWYGFWSKLKKTSLPHWTKDFHITPLSAYWELRYASEMRHFKVEVSLLATARNEKRCKDMYITDLNTAHSDNLTCLSAQGENAEITKFVTLVLKKSRSDHPSESIHVIFDKSGRIEKLQNKKDFEMEELLQIQRDGLNSELAEEYHLHESNNPKEVDADDEPDEGLGPIDNAEQR
ncbi:hypothetical protein KY289_016623 [Solanum tuberosum]|nr:hypothetical protein KY289_016623 [Solanum tuberosum]